MVSGTSAPTQASFSPQQGYLSAAPLGEATEPPCPAEAETTSGWGSTGPCSSVCAAVLAPAVLGWRMVPPLQGALCPSSQRAHGMAFWAGFFHCLTQIGPTATSDLSSSFLNLGLSSL